MHTAPSLSHSDLLRRAFWQEQMQTDLETWKDRLLIGLDQEYGKHGDRFLKPFIIGKDLVVRGDLAFQGDIQVDGTIEGGVKGVTIRVGDGGLVNGIITADSVLIAGTVSGRIRSKAVVLARTARVQADLWVDTLTIETGARFAGACKRFASEAEAGVAADEYGRSNTATLCAASSPSHAA